MIYVLSQSELRSSSLMHRIPSEFRSEAWLDESSTRMGDFSGSPRVAPI